MSSSSPAPTATVVTKHARGSGSPASHTSTTAAFGRRFCAAFEA